MSCGEVHVIGIPATPRVAAEVDTAVRRLDGNESDLLLLERTDGRRMTIGGGPTSFVCEISENETDRWALISNAHSPEETVSISVGAPIVDYPADWCVELPEILQAVEAFLSEGARSSELVWAQVT